MRAAFERHGGREEGTEGDSFFVAFASASDAVAAAIDAQRALAAEPWPDDAPIRVRMGLNAGEVGKIGGNLVGLEINRAARIAAVAHGGQVLVSETVRALAGGTPPDTTTFLDLGAHRLKDLRDPQRIYQVTSPGLESSFPPLATLDARPNNLPTQLTSFVGRETELTEAGRLLASDAAS